MGLILIVLVLLHATASYRQLTHQPGPIRQRDTQVRGFVWVVIACKEYLIMPALFIFLVLYARNSMSPLWMGIEVLDVWWLQIIGLLGMVSSIVLKVYAYQTLGTNWSRTPTIYEDHTLIQRGPYRWMRHPVYTSNILLLCGVFCATTSVTLLLLGITYFSTDVVRAKAEEVKLMVRFGDEYAQYALMVGKYAPLAVTMSFIFLVIAANLIGIIDEASFTLTGDSILLGILERW